MAVSGFMSGIKSNQKARVVAFEDLGMEAIYEFEVEDMPVTVAVDSEGQKCMQLVRIFGKSKSLKKTN